MVVDYKTNWLGDPDTAVDGRRLRPAATGRGDAALGLSAAGAAVQRCAAQVSAVAAARVRTREASRRRDVSVPAGHVRAGHAVGGRPSGRGVQLAAAGGAGRRAVGSTGRAVGRDGTTDDDRRSAPGVRGATGTAADIQRSRCARGRGRPCRARGSPPWPSEPDETVALAMALAVRALRNGSVCLDLGAEEVDVGRRLPWPRVDEWLAQCGPARCRPRRRYCASMAIVLYLDRYWLEEEQVCDDLLGASRSTAVDEAAWLWDRSAVPGAARANSGLRPRSRCRSGRRSSPVAGHGQDHHRGRLLALLAAGRLGGIRRCGSRWRHRPARRRPGCRRRCSWRSAS